MIVGFEELTYELTEREKTLLPGLMEVLNNAKGSSAAVKNSRIVKFLIDAGYTGATEVRVRKLINFIRVKNLIPWLVATSKGYFIAETSNEVEIFIESLRQRARMINEVADSLAAHLSKH